MLDFFKRRRREELRARPLPPEWRAVIEENVPYLREEREEESSLIHDFRSPRLPASL
ncbi:MAG: hypothetical protein IT372_36840 [Polyangiaceae bacterium]|nr:hypothetical protein [Polyangiaceae bacterium]